MLNLWARFLYEPLLQDRVRRIQETDDPQYRPRGRRDGPCGAEAHRRREAAARIRADGPLGDRPRRRVPAAAGRAELVAGCSMS